jgi:hypothetical protein
VHLDDALGLIAEVPDFPEPGVLFRDLSPLFADAGAFKAVTDALAGTLDPGVEALAGVEARGFLLAAAVGYARGLGVVLVRKPGKLPKVAGRVDYALEYGTATVELPADVVRRASGSRSSTTSWPRAARSRRRASSWRTWEPSSTACRWSWNWVRWAAARSSATGRSTPCRFAEPVTRVIRSVIRVIGAGTREFRPRSRECGLESRGLRVRHAG